MGLWQRTATNIGWTAVAQGLSIGSSQIVLLVLANILTTEDFGVYAACTIVNALITQSSTLGLDYAVVNSRDDWRKVINSGTTLRLALSTASFVAIVALSGQISRLFSIDNLPLPLILASSTCLILAFAFPSQMVLTKSLRFKQLSYARISASLVWSVTALSLALLAWSYWSLVIAFVGSQIAYLVCVVLQAPERVRFETDRRTANRLIGFGGITAAGLFLAFLAGNLDKFVVGSMIGPDALGIYWAMYAYGTAAPGLLTGIINLVMFPTYTALSEKPDSLKKAYSETLRFVSEFASVVSIGLAAGSTLFVMVLLGPKWQDGIMSLSLLSIAGFFLSITSPAGNVFISVGRPDLIFRITLTFFVPMVPLLLISTSMFGITGAAAVIVAHEGAKCTYVVHRAGRLIGLGDGEIFGHIAPFIAAGAVAGVVVLASNLFAGTTLFSLLLAMLLGIATYIGSGTLLSKGVLLRDVAEVIKVIRGH